MDAVAAAYGDDHAIVFGRGMAIPRDSKAAADLTHEAFMRLTLEAQAGRLPDAPRAWLLTVVANAACSRGRRLSTVARFADRLPHPPEPPGPEDVYLRREASVELDRRLAALSPAERKALILAAHGVHGREIATSIGRSYTATRVLLHRGRLRLRASLAIPLALLLVAATVGL